MNVNRRNAAAAAAGLCLLLLLAGVETRRRVRLSRAGRTAQTRGAWRDDAASPPSARRRGRDSLPDAAGREAGARGAASSVLPPPKPFYRRIPGRGGPEEAAGRAADAPPGGGRQELVRKRARSAGSGGGPALGSSAHAGAPGLSRGAGRHADVGDAGAADGTPPIEDDDAPMEPAGSAASARGSSWLAPEVSFDGGTGVLPAVPRRAPAGPGDAPTGPVYHFGAAEVTDVYSDMEGLESDQTEVINGRKMRLATQIMQGEKVEVIGPETGGWVEVYIPGQDLKGYIRADMLSRDAKLAQAFPVRSFPPRKPGQADPRREAFVAETRKLEGVPYVWGGRSPRGVDCSGLVQLAASYVGMGNKVPRTSRQQKANAEPVDPARLQRGDLVFTSKGPGKPISHVVVYLGEGRIREAPRTGSVVRSRSFSGRFGVTPEQAARGYDSNRGYPAGKYMLFFGTYFE